MTSILPFAQRACFIAGQAKSGTTLLAALLDNHPELLVLPEETAYFPTVLTKYAPRGRRAQFDYITKESRSNVLFAGPSVRGKRDYADFPRTEFLETFERAAFDSARIDNDLLVLLVESYAATLGIPLDRIKRWVEKTPANRDHIATIVSRFPRAKILVTMRDPRAILAAQTDFSEISRDPVSRWERELSDDEIGWIEWHCRDLMPEFGYEPRLNRHALRHWAKPIRGERPREYLKSRAYSLRDDWIRR